MEIDLDDCFETKLTSKSLQLPKEHFGSGINCNDLGHLDLHNEQGGREAMQQSAPLQRPDGPA
jgi:hypothetical protein